LDRNRARAGVADRVVVHTGFAADVAASWTDPIDLLFLDGDQSVAGARASYDVWSPFLKPGGMIALHNSSTDHQYAVDHDGHLRLAVEELHPSHYLDCYCVDTTTFARKG
jgi:predicted O-methyltransferase YrrM